MAFKPEFLIEGKWYGNSLKFATKEEAEANALQKYTSWIVPTDWRATECEGEVNYRFDFETRQSVSLS